MNLINLLLLVALVGGLLLLVSPSAEATEATVTKTGSLIQGKVVDVGGDPVSNATVALQGPAGNRLTAVTNDDGSFAFNDVTPGIVYDITVTAEGLSGWTSSITPEPGQTKDLDIKLRIAAVERSVTVSYSSKEIAAQQLKDEEQQRVLGFIPNLYVTYEAHPEPLTTKMKFHLAYKDLTHPVFYIREVAWAGVQQARDNPSEWRQGWNAYGKRLGAGFADGVTGSLITNAILPSLLHQDPRYFYQGDGTKKSRALHAILAPFICKGDNGVTQPNYSQWAGSLISYSISTAYYPSSDRTVGHVFGNFGIDMGLHIVGSLAQEFILARFTSKHKHQ